MINLHTASTPNGRKILIALEEIDAPFKATFLNLGAGDQFVDGFLQLNPNNKIPVIEDIDNGVVLWESGAILLYLGENYDPHNRILPTTMNNRWEAIQYAFFQTGGLGPNLGRLATQLERLDADRNGEMVSIFSTEVDRLLGVLDRILADGRDYLAKEFSIADIMHYPWLRPVIELKAPQLMSRTRVVEWIQKIAARPSIERAYHVQ